MQRNERQRGLEFNGLKKQPLQMILLVIGFKVILNYFWFFQVCFRHFWLAFGFLWVILGCSASIWVIMDHLALYGSFWLLMDHFGSFWVTLADSIVQ